MVLVILSVTGWVLFAGSWVGTEAVYTHMHCPVCEDEVIYSARMASSECPICKGGAYVPTIGSVREGTIGPGTGGKIFIFLVIAVVAVQGLVYLVFQRSKIMRQTEQETRNKLLVCRCPYCQRKIGFRASKAGTGGVCPRCKTAFIYSSQAEAEAEEAS